MGKDDQPSANPELDSVIARLNESPEEMARLGGLLFPPSPPYHPARRGLTLRPLPLSLCLASFEPAGGSLSGACCAAHLLYSSLSAALFAARSSGVSLPMSPRV